MLVSEDCQILSGITSMSMTFMSDYLIANQIIRVVEKMKCQTYWSLSDQIASIRSADRQEVGSQISSRVAYQRASPREPSRHRAMQMMPRITQIFRSRITHVFKVVGTVYVHLVCVPEFQRVFS